MEVMEADSLTLKDYITRRIELEQKRFSVCVRVDPKIDLQENPFTGDRIVRAINDLAVREVERFEYKWPKDWKQAVKLRFAPKWFLKRWPVKYEKHGHVVYTHYPDFDIHHTRSIVVVERPSPEFWCDNAA